jgi:hypothetical protein
VLTIKTQGALTLDMDSRLGMCLSRCSLRENRLPQCVHHRGFPVDVASADIAATAFCYTPPALYVSSFRLSCGWPFVNQRVVDRTLLAQGRCLKAGFGEVDRLS